tara:strand:- start:3699 stop:4127 length:429 start_codon:yes stop_codon:yes gene_type:complete
MYKVTAWFKDKKISQEFHDVHDAIEYRDDIDAHYPTKIIFRKVISMREFIFNSWNVVMDHEKNPLSNIPDFSTRHMIMQVLAWMWCIVFAIIVGSMWAGVFSMMLHTLLLGAIAITVATFETAKRKPQYFGGYGRGNGGEHE